MVGDSLIYTYVSYISGKKVTFPRYTPRSLDYRHERAMLTQQILTSINVSMHVIHEYKILLELMECICYNGTNQSSCTDQ